LITELHLRSSCK